MNGKIFGKKYNNFIIHFTTGSGNLLIILLRCRFIFRQRGVRFFFYSRDKTIQIYVRVSRCNSSIVIAIDNAKVTRRPRWRTLHEIVETQLRFTVVCLNNYVCI